MQIKAKIIDNSYANPAIRAIENNDVLGLRALLDEGKIPDLEYAFTGVGNNDTSPEILDLLVEYNALPEGVSLSTLKFVLFAMGNARIPVSDFWDKPDLNLNGYSKKPSPMELFASAGNTQSVLALIQRGVTTRPISSILDGIHPTHFMGCDLLNINAFKAQITSKFIGTEFYNLEKKCMTLEILLSHPTSELDTLIATDNKFPYYGVQYLAFFSWAAMNDKDTLFNLPYFKQLFQKNYSSAKEAIVVAAAFGSVNFLKRAILENLVEAKDIAKACNIAAANGDNSLLITLMTIPQSEKIHKEDFVRKVSGIYFFENPKSPLFWAVRNGHTQTAEILLKAGASPNDPIDTFSSSSYLQLATKYKHTELMKLLLRHGAFVNHQNSLGYTALHDAAEGNLSDAIEILLAAGADKNLANSSGDRPLNSIQEKEMRVGSSSASSSSQKFFSNGGLSSGNNYSSTKCKL